MLVDGLVMVLDKMLVMAVLVMDVVLMLVIVLELVVDFLVLVVMCVFVHESSRCGVGVRDRDYSIWSSSVSLPRCSSTSFSSRCWSCVSLCCSSSSC